jgi:ABC-type transport system involved in multi-copper enzyme maturation permease subunit
VSDLSEVTDTVPAAIPARGGLPWGRWWGQTRAVVRLELRKNFRRPFGLLLLALAPLFILVLRLLIPHALRDNTIADSTQFYAGLYQAFLLRIVIFLACVSIFGNLIRRETLDRSLHYYFLSPIRREVLVVGKYLTGLLVSFGLFGATTVVSFVLAYLPQGLQGFQSFLFKHPAGITDSTLGIVHLGAYLLVTFLACVGYGAVFLFFGFFFKSPAIPALVVFGWEGIHFLLPPLLKEMSVIHYLQSLSPVPVPEGPLATLADAPAPWVSILGLLALAVVLVAVSGWKIRRMEISYDES